jgi:Zn-dependent peptidase ImmA (M78 family)
MIKNSSLSGIKYLAESIALEYLEVITPLEKIIEEEELTLYYDTYGDTFDGMTIHDNDFFYIHINTFRGNKPDTPRARFTIAHELAHYFIDNHRLGLMKGYLTPHISRNNEESHSKIEREADYFASCLLMPEIRFKQFVNRKKFDYELLAATALYFKTSVTATAIRFAAIGNHPLMIVFGKEGKIMWKWSSEDFPYQYLVYTNKIPENSVMGEYFYEDKAVSGTEQVWAIDWFNYIRDTDLNKKLNEHCIVHNNLALSIIWGE